ncbi:MAG: DNA recombination protein RmuC [Wolbachia sp.]
MPSEKQIIIDAKVPLDSYLDAMSQNDLQIQRKKLRNYSLAIKHINDLGKKNIEINLKIRQSLLYFPHRGGAFSAALEYEPALIEIGGEKCDHYNIDYFDLTAYGNSVWMETGNDSRKCKISELGHILYERICTMGENFDNLRRSLKSAIDHYNKTACLPHSKQGCFLLPESSTSLVYMQK